MRISIILLGLALALAALAGAAATPSRPAGGGIQSITEFPIAVWLQDPRNAPRYKAIGINRYVGLWEGPTAQQLADLEKAGMPVICGQNPEALKPRWNREIVAWMHDDEPDNAQSLGEGKGYGPPITPDSVVAKYQIMKQSDNRPVLLNLGQGIAWDGWVGRGVRTDKPEDYPLYVKGADILSFDIYPAVHTHKDVAGKLEYVAHGTRRLVTWTEGRKPVWACIECTHIANPDKKPTAAQVRAEVWLAITHGARGLIYFAHEFAPRFVEAGLLQDADMAKAVSQINREIQELAPAILNSQTVEPAGVNDAAIATLTCRDSNFIYVFAVGMSDAAVKTTFTLNQAADSRVDVMGEQRTLQARSGQWTDEFTGYQVHRYRLPAPARP